MLGEGRPRIVGWLRRRGARLASLAVAIVASLPGTTHALTLRAADVWIDPSQTDRFMIVGRVGRDLALDAADTLTLSLDRFTFDVPVSASARKHRRLSYRSAPPGLTHLVLDPSRGRFIATAAGLALSGLPNPITIGLTTGTTSECATVRLRRRGGMHRRRRADVTGPSRVHLTLGPEQVPASCEIVDIPLVDPVGIPVDTPTSVRVVAAPPARVDANSVRLLRADAAGTPLRAPLCTLHDDGGGGDATAGDGLYTCLVTLAEPSPTTIPLVVEATVGGRLVTSSGFAITVVPPFAPSDAAAIVALQQHAAGVWTDASQRLGDTLAARIEVVRILRTTAGIADAAIGGNGLDITIHYPSGVIGGLMLSPRVVAGFPQAIGNAVAAARPVAASTPASDAVGNGDVLLWNAGFFTTTEMPALQQILGLSGDPTFAVTVRGPDEATPEGLRDLTAFGTVAFVTHGVVDDDRQVAFLTGRRADSAALDTYSVDLQDGRLTVKTAYILDSHGPTADYIAVRPAFIANLDRRFDHTLVYAGFCNGLRNQSLFTSFSMKGASSFFGYNQVVGNEFATSVAPKIFCGLVSDHLSSDGAYEPIDPKNDHGTRLKLAGDPSLAYAGLPGPPANFALTPPVACVSQGESVLFSVTPGTGPTPLAPCVTYEWTNTALAGTLTSGDSTLDKSRAPTASYRRTAATDETDTIGVTVVDVNDAKLGTAAATVLAASDPRCMTTTTTTTTTSTSSTTTPACMLPAPFISRCADFAVTPDVVPVGDTFTVSLDFTSDGGAPCGASACVYCGAFATLVDIDGAPPTDPSGCGVTPGMHTATFKANFAACPAWCYVAEPGNWGTGHPFIIGE